MHDVARPVSNRPMQSKAKPRRKGIVIAIALLVMICVFAFGIKILQIVKMTSTPMVMPPTTVSSVTVKEEDWAPRLTAVGSVSAVQGAVVSAELAGVVSEINFENGAAAKKGEVLMKLDASQEEALLRSAEAEAQLAQTDLERSRDLAMKKVVSSAELDSAQSKFRRLNAVVDQVRSSIAKKRGPTSGAAHFTRPSLRRFRLAAAISWSVNSGLGGARDDRRHSRPCVQWEVDRN